VVEHLEDNDGFVLHLRTADLRRLAMQSFDTGRADVLDRLLAPVDVALSRKEQTTVRTPWRSRSSRTRGWWNPTTQLFIEAWPAGLRAEVDRQRSHRQ
jgi:hypothetical protein